MNLKVGDLVSVDYKTPSNIYDPGRHYLWSGVCTWTCGNKFEFLIDGDFDTWTLGDLELVGAQVVSENKN